MSMVFAATNNLRSAEDLPGRTIKWTFDFHSQAKINTDATFDDDDEVAKADDDDDDDDDK
ncbi:hypothetical protein B1810_07785 [Panacagrimonas perspica]|uniref:hypothetical protein n=1 Tax=Panacagrimonas perspica TaxID=381431 RepID=UPI00105E45A1|nr:hypothetical protein [Panacagrimonas perspica]THD03771.1 hypothetical protein B1810_07785 [Panacagrimonas perspica]